MSLHKWLIVIYDDSIQQGNFENNIGAHLNRYKKFSIKKAPLDVEPITLWSDFDLIVGKWKLDNPITSDEIKKFVENRILPSIRSEKRRIGQIKGLSVIMNRNLFVRHGLLKLYEFIVSYSFFKPTRFPQHFVCCYGDVSGGLADSGVTPVECCWGEWCCTFCQNNKVAVCRHTCYWRLIGLMLEAFPEQYPSKNRSYDVGIQKALPKTYIH